MKVKKSYLLSIVFHVDPIVQKTMRTYLRMMSEQMYLEVNRQDEKPTPNPILDFTCEILNNITLIKIWLESYETLDLIRFDLENSFRINSLEYLLMGQLGEREILYELDSFKTLIKPRGKLEVKLVIGQPHDSEAMGIESFYAA